jgi:hypothetical protein
MGEFNEAQLPEPCLLPSPRASDYYGTTATAARYCRIPVSVAVIPGIWQHGNSPRHLKVDPILVLGAHDPAEKERELFWVARADEEAYLQGMGYRNVKAIGLPIIYLPPKTIRRIPGSLLVMPAHSLDFTTHSWNCERYAEEIAAIRSAFSEVVVCVHASCWKNGYWVEAFKRRGFPVITGCHATDWNSLERMRTLLSAFEYVTTNIYGSHVPYAAYFGAKVSIYGTYAELQPQNYAKEAFWRPYPRLLEQLIRAHSQSVIREAFPELFCHPLQANPHVEWGQSEVGLANKVTPVEMRRLFNWTPRALAKAIDEQMIESRRANEDLRNYIDQIETGKAWIIEQWKREEGLLAEARRLVDEKDQALAKMSHQLAQVSHELAQVSHELAQTTGSLSYRLAQRMARVRTLLAPEDTTRSRSLKKLIRTVTKLIRGSKRAA